LMTIRSPLCMGFSALAILGTGQESSKLNPQRWVKAFYQGLILDGAMSNVYRS
jgi:hypothetical protein